MYVQSLIFNFFYTFIEEEAQVVIPDENEEKNDKKEKEDTDKNKPKDDKKDNKEKSEEKKIEKPKTEKEIEEEKKKVVDIVGANNKRNV